MKLKLIWRLYCVWKRLHFLFFTELICTVMALSKYKDFAALTDIEFYNILKGLDTAFESYVKETSEIAEEFKDAQIDALEKNE